ncbi:MAG: hypothetical protein ACTSRN_06060 [Alphaproteobacteria bacterium]
MVLIDHFSVANLLGHSAFEQLDLGLEVYKDLARMGVIGAEGLNWVEYQGLGGLARISQKKELKHCMQAVILFQAMMEKVPYFVPNIETGLNAPSSKKSFATSWKFLLAQINCPTERKAAEDSFEHYDEYFYRKYRNPIIHGKKQSDVIKVNAIQVVGVHEGMRRGWDAYDALLKAAFGSKQLHQSSWGNMCRAAGIPSELDEDAYPNLADLSRRYLAKFEAGLKGHGQ